jgi:SHS2 domain-containing protein
VLLEASAGDIDALLVDWMNEVLFTLETTDACVAAVDVAQMTDTTLRGSLVFAPCAHEPEGTELKATTYHQLSVRKTDSRWEATVYFDV